MVNRSYLAISGLFAFILEVIGHPLWLSVTAQNSALVWMFWGFGIAFIGVAAALAMFGAYEFLQYLFGALGWTWFVLWFFQCFPNFTISLV